MALLFVIQGAMYVLGILGLSVEIIWKIARAAACVPALLGDFIFLMWVISALGDKETDTGKTSLARGIMLNMLSIVAF